MEAMYVVNTLLLRALEHKVPNTLILHRIKEITHSFAPGGIRWCVGNKLRWGVARAYLALMLQISFHVLAMS
jgi:hypothetical protein